jgi:hypothetical protein
MKASTPTLSAEQYEGLVAGNIGRLLGLSADQAAEIAANRWPMDANSAICECEGRGLRLDLTDLTHFLRDKFQRDTFDDGAPLVAESLGWLPYLVDELLEWAIDQDRGEAAGESARTMPTTVSVPDMFKGLKSDNIVERLEAGFSLSRSLGVGLAIAGEDRLDIEHIIAPSVGELLGRAIHARDLEAIAELEAAITTVKPVRRLGAT